MHLEQKNLSNLPTAIAIALVSLQVDASTLRPVADPVISLQSMATTGGLSDMELQVIQISVFSAIFSFVGAFVDFRSGFLALNI